MFLFKIRFFKKIFVIFIIFFNLTASASNLSIDLQTQNLSYALRVIAKQLNMNVIVSPKVMGEVVLNLNNMSPEEAFDSILSTHQLVKVKQGHVWLIIPQTELIKVKQDELKWMELDEDISPVVTRVWQINYAKADDIARLLQDEHTSLLSKRGRLRVDSRTNIICIQDTTKRIGNIHFLIKHLDVPVQQICIAARLVSIDSDFERELGIQFIQKENLNNDKQVKSHHYSLAVVKLADESFLDIKLTALENEGHAELISNPSLFTSNQQAASIESGEEIPYQEVSVSGGTAVVFKKAVLGLKVTPQILPGKSVLLQLQINQDRPSSKMIQGMPAITTRQMITNVQVKSGHTIVLGGIYEMNSEHEQSGLPFLSHIPCLGFLFKQQNIRNNKRELLIFVTPTIL